MQLISHFERAVERHPDRIAFVQPDGTLLTYRDAASLMSKVAAALVRTELPADAQVAVYSPNDGAGFLAMLAAIRAGHAWVSLNARNTVADNIALAQMADARVLIYHSDFAREAELIRAAIPEITLFLCIDRQSNGDGCIAGLPDGGSDVLPELADDDARPCTVFATGGTTGRSKGAIWTNQVWETLLANYWTCAPPCDHPVHLCVAPMTHGAGALALMLLPRAPTNVLMVKADPVAILEAIQKHRVTHMFLPPTVLYALLSCPTLSDYDTSSLIFFLISAAPVSADKLREAVAAFGPIMCQSFGQAEAPFFLTYLSPHDHELAIRSPNHARLLQSCGRPTMFSRVEVMGVDGAILPLGETGEIVARSNLVMAGYYKDPAATAAVSGHGWHHTGDIGFMDSDGYVYIVDRKRDMIISGGFNVYSTEVEGALLSHSAVMDCAVIGIPDEKWGEAVKAVVELKPGSSVTSDELIVHCHALLGGVKTPKTLDIWESLPRSPVGKILKRAIRDTFWTDQQRAV